MTRLGGASLQLTLTATQGTITLSTITGLSFTVGDGTADAAMIFTGTLTNINAALNGATFTPTLAFIGAATIQIDVDDQGNTGVGGAMTDSATVNISVAISKSSDEDDEGCSTGTTRGYTLVLALVALLLVARRRLCMA